MTWPLLENLRLYSVITFPFQSRWHVYSTKRSWVSCHIVKSSLSYIQTSQWLSVLKWPHCVRKIRLSIQEALISQTTLLIFLASDPRNLNTSDQFHHLQNTQYPDPSTHKSLIRTPTSKTLSSLQLSQTSWISIPDIVWYLRVLFGHSVTKAPLPLPTLHDWLFIAKQISPLLSLCRFYVRQHTAD